MLATIQDNIKKILCQEEAGQAAVGEEVDVAVVEGEENRAWMWSRS